MKNFLFAGLVLSSTALIACGGDDPPADPDPVAELRFYHAVPTQGPLEITVNDETVTIDPQTISSVIELDPGVVSFSMGVAGAPSPLFTDNLGELDEGAHAFIVTEIGTGNFNVFEAGMNRPVPQEGLFHFQVVNLSDLDREVYFDSTEANTIAPLEASPFYDVAATDVPIAIDTYNVGDDPATDSPSKRYQITSEELTAPLTLLLLGYNSTSAEWAFTPVEL